MKRLYTFIFACRITGSGWLVSNDGFSKRRAKKQAIKDIMIRCDRGRSSIKCVKNK